MIGTIAVGVQGRPSSVPSAADNDNWVSAYKLIGSPSFTEGITAVSSIVFAYAGTPGKPYLIFGSLIMDWLLDPAFS